MTRSVRAAFVLALVISIAGLTACGGGGGDDVSPPLPPVPPPTEPVEPPVDSPTEPPVGPTDPVGPPEPAIHGQCGQAVNQCDAGLFADLTDTDASHQWQCGGSNGGATATCALPKPPPEPVIHGQCGQAVNQCDAGLFADLADSDASHQWQCGGSNGGATATCALPKPPPEPAIHGQCGQAVNQCDAGLFADLTDTDTDHRWSCGGQHGGITASCTLPKPPTERRGALTVPGIDLIPLNLMKLSNKEMQRQFVVTDIAPGGAFGDHAKQVRRMACHSYITGCPDFGTDAFAEGYPGKALDKHGNVVLDRAEGTTPFTFLGTDFVEGNRDWLYDELAVIKPKIVTQSLNPAAGLVTALGVLPYLVIQSAGNDAEDRFGRYVQSRDWDNIHAAIAAELDFVQK